MFNLPPTTSFLQSWFLASWHPACVGAWDYSSLDTGFCTSLCWTLWGFCQSISPARGGPPERPPFRPTCFQIQCQILSLLNVLITPLSWSLIQMLNSLGCGFSSWGVPLKTSYQLDLYSLCPAVKTVFHLCGGLPIQSVRILPYGRLHQRPC